MTNNPRSNGGRARAQALSPKKRSEIAKCGGIMRWNQDKPKATHFGILEIGELKIPCAVLDNGMRVLSDSGISESFGSRTGGAIESKRKALTEGRAPLPTFVSSERLKPFISKELEAELSKPVVYTIGTTLMQGYSAELLPQICDVWLKAREARVLQKQQINRAQKAEILMRGLAHLGVVALVDEATGFEKERAKGDLAKILEAFIAKELRPWVRTFPTEYYQHLFRLRGLDFTKDKIKRPQYFGHITNDIVYERLAPAVLDSLKKEATKDVTCKYKKHLHRRLSEDVGHPKLKEHLSSVVTIMKLSNDYEDFKKKLDLIHPSFNETIELPFEEPTSGI